MKRMKLESWSVAATKVGVLCCCLLCLQVAGIGVNWGTQSTHPMDPKIIVRMLLDNDINKVKLFDADYSALRALGKTRMEVMVGIPNDMLESLGSNMKSAEKWVSQNVSDHISSHSVNIRYVAVGNEPFLETYNGTYLNTTFPALQNIQSALIKAGLSTRVKVTVPLNADVYTSSTSVPSGGDFRPSIHGYMLQIVKFLSDNGGVFTANIYPFISLYTDPNFPVEYAFFDDNSNSNNSTLNDGGTEYSNMFDANYDTLVWALKRNGYGNLPVIVGEIGWPTDGDINANLAYARRFNQGFVTHISSGRGTPMRPGLIDYYLFSLIDEDDKSIQPGNFERHWGLFTFDGLPKYQLNLKTRTMNSSSTGLVGAKGVQYLSNKWCVLSDGVKLSDTRVGDSVSYACGLADCTSLGYGTSCGGLDARGNVSYAFNSYYQLNNQEDVACKFGGLGAITTSDPSSGTCRFIVQIQPLLSAANNKDCITRLMLLLFSSSSILFYLLF